MSVSEGCFVRAWRYSVMWYVGGMLYTGLELLWRGWSHGSMFAAGGLCFVLIGHLGELPRPMPLLPRAVLGAGIITAVELGAGLLVNRQFRVWDYRHLPGNFLGQICLPFTLLWIPVSLAAIFAYDRLSGTLFGSPRVRYHWV